MDFVSAEHYARHLATYIASPLKIEALVKLDFSRNIPPLHAIAEWRYQHEQRGRREFAPMQCHDSATNDHVDFAPRSLILPEPRRVGRPPKPVRARDYIWVDAEPIAPSEPPKNPYIGRYATGRRLVQSVAHDFGLYPSEVTGRGRSRPLVQARAVVAVLLRETGRSYPMIGNVLGGRDHSSVMWLVQEINKYIHQNDAVSISLARHRKLRAEAERLDAEMAEAA